MPFQCKSCPKNFQFKGGLHKHIRVVHKNLLKFICEECEQRFDTMRGLRIHQVVKFHLCSFQGAGKELIKKRKVNEKNEEEEKEEEEEEDEEEENEKENEEEEDEEEEEEEDVLGRKKKCTECGVRFPSRIALEVHLEIAHKKKLAFTPLAPETQKNSKSHQHRLQQKQKERRSEPPRRPAPRQHSQEQFVQRAPSPTPQFRPTKASSSSASTFSVSTLSSNSSKNSRKRSAPSKATTKTTRKVKELSPSVKVLKHLQISKSTSLINNSSNDDVSKKEKSPHSPYLAEQLHMLDQLSKSCAKDGYEVTISFDDENKPILKLRFICNECKGTLSSVRCNKNNACCEMLCTHCCIHDD